MNATLARARARIRGARLWRGSIGAGLTLAVAGAIAGYAWYRTLTAEPATTPQIMTWYKADGSPVADRPSYPGGSRYCGGDMHLDIAAWRHGAMVSCTDETIGRGWAWLDPITKRAELRWPLPEGLRLARTRGLIPGPGDHLAIVFESVLHGPLHVGIAGPRGWSRAPERFDRVVYRGAAWVGSNLEVVVTPTTADDEYGLHQPDTIVTFAGGRRTERRAGGTVCNRDYCQTAPIAYRAGGRWIFEGLDRAVTETGEAATPVVPGMHEHLDVDLLWQGKLDFPGGLLLGTPIATIDPDGKAGALPPPPGSDLEIMLQDRFVIDQRIWRRLQWSADRGRRTLVEQLDGRTLVTHLDEHDRLRIADGADELQEARPVARWSQNLEGRLVYPDLAGGYWVLDGNGEHIHLDGALHRTDARSLREHLRQGGSARYDGDEPEHERHLAWALFGLPILLVGFYLLVALALGPGTPSRWRPRAAPITAAAGVYAVSALIALSRVLPLLG